MENETKIDGFATPATIAEPTPVTVVTPRKPRVVRASSKPRRMASSFDNVVKIARGITVANASDKIARVNASDGRAVNGPGKNVGRYTNRRIVAFQNWTLVENADWQLSDVQLLAVWRMEFPAAVGRVFVAPIADGIRIVRDVRAHYNRDGHDDPNGKPAVPSVAYNPPSSRMDAR